MIYVDVTQDDISGGEPGICATCPVALAMSRAAGLKISAGVYSWWYANNILGGRFPEIVSDWIRDFDEGLSVKPFVFIVYEV